MDVKQMKGRQESMDDKLGTIKRENEALWRELAALRQKHAKQQQIVSKVMAVSSLLLLLCSCIDISSSFV